MQTVKASVILEDAYRLMRWDLDQLEDTEKADAFTALSQALQEVWEAWWWENLMTVEAVQLRDTYASGTTYAAGDEVYFPATQQYYQALRSTLGNAPATATDGDYTTDYRFWADAELLPADGDYEADTTSGLEPGSRVRLPDDGYDYQLLTYLGADLIPGGAVYNGSNSYFVTLDAGETYQFVPGANDNYIVRPAGSPEAMTTGRAVFIEGGGTLQIVTSGSAGIPLTCALNVTTSVTTYPEAPESTAWARVSVFAPTLETSREVRMVSRLDPRSTNNPGAYDFTETTDGVRLTEIPERTPYVWARRVTPVIADDCTDFDAAATYSATAATELVFDS